MPHVYHKSRAEMRRGQQCLPEEYCDHIPLPNHPQIPCPAPYVRCRNSCIHAPYYCFRYRNMSFWCEYCMSRYMFPEHYVDQIPPPQYCVPSSYYPPNHLGNPPVQVCQPTCYYPQQTCSRPQYNEGSSSCEIPTRQIPSSSSNNCERK